MNNLKQDRIEITPTTHPHMNRVERRRMQHKLNRQLRTLRRINQREKGSAK